MGRVMGRERISAYGKHHSSTGILSTLGMGGCEAQMPSNTPSIPVLLYLAEWLWNSLWSVCTAFLSTPIITTSCLSTTPVCCPPKTMRWSHIFMWGEWIYLCLPLSFLNVLMKLTFSDHLIRVEITTLSCNICPLSLGGRHSSSQPCLKTQLNQTG